MGLMSLSGDTRGVKGDGRTDRGEILERESQHDAVISAADAIDLIVAHVKPERRYPAAEVAMNFIGLVLQLVIVQFVLLIRAECPIVIDAQIGAESDQVRIREKGIIVDQ